ncbi:MULTISPECIES: hypothetical protein [Thalassospira]|uniref:TNase-like domain-containing protein n=2 Tax=Thalassospira tepidiphila TaxID=393657 RepID=A0A853L433_9PROT|nr:MULTISPECIES: hypothetical protein [Thalassospira]MBO6580066.1 hypothetical protein [Thalassospira sp.]MBO6801801.1 hypothetical protein [Thalassospira sp.]MBO6817322.1 hypothetical protein [Thalassospira sp.]MBO6887854.1 hypothetical protein [Thalassospira sp.]NJB73832.1 hypothetical protein [Thalassospira tepidiphila]
MLLVVVFCGANLPVMAADWRCGADIIAGDAKTLLSTDPRPVWRDVQLNIEAVDAFAAAELPGKSFRLADIAFVPGYGDAARVWLEQASANKVSITPLAERSDFLGRIPVRIEDQVIGDWQAELLAAGLAMLVPESDQDMSELIGIEDTAIKNHSGIWSDPSPETAYYVRAHDAGAENIPTARDAIGRFAVIDGKIRSIEHQEWRSYLNFGSNWREDFTIALDATLRDAFANGEDFQDILQDWVGQEIRVRGVIENRGGPYIALENPFWLCLARSSRAQ